MGSAFGSNIETDSAAGLPEVKMAPAVISEPPVVERAPVKITEPRVRIILEDNDGIPPTGLFLGLNGTGYMLKANMAADVPVGIVNILNDAIMSVPVVDSETRQVVGFKNRLRFPYRVIAHVPVAA